MEEHRLPEDKQGKQLLRLIQDSGSDPLDVMKTVGTYQRYLDAIEMRAVKAARAMGRTWEEIAQAMGVRRQSAWSRYRVLEKVVRENMAKNPK